MINSYKSAFHPMVVLSEDLISLIYIKEQQAHVETNQQEYTCAFFNKYFTCNYI